MPSSLTVVKVHGPAVKSMVRVQRTEKLSTGTGVPGPPSAPGVVDSVSHRTSSGAPASGCPRSTPPGTHPPHTN